MAKKNVIVSSVIVLAVMAICAAVYAEHEGGVVLPEAVKAAIKALYPAGEIEEAKMEKEGLKLYEVEVDANGVEAEITADAEGTIAEVTTKEKVESLPAAVAQTVAAQGGKAIEAEKEVTHAQAKLVKLDAPLTTYEVKIEKDGKTTEIEIAADGKILPTECPKEKMKCDKALKEKMKCEKEKMEKKECKKDKEDKEDKDD
jgi:outer membrane protein assembly factor BamA